MNNQPSGIPPYVKRVGIVVPELAINQSREYGILHGSMETTYQRFTSTSFSNQSIFIQANPSNQSTITDRTMYLDLPITIQFTGTAPPGQALLQTGLDSLRSFPISAITQTLNVQINNTQFTIQPNELTQPLLRSGHSAEFLDKTMGLCPTAYDESQEYYDLNLSVRNPLAGYGDSIPGTITGRGAFPIEYVTNTNTNATITARLSEPLFLSPFTDGGDRAPGFVGVQTMSFTWTLGNLERLWSHATGPGSSTLTSIVVTIGQPQLLVRYYIPNQRLMQRMALRNLYALSEVQRYITETGTPVPANAGVTITSGVVTLGRIPHRMLFFVRERLADWNATTTDTYFAINQINIQWGAKTSILASATQRQLYQMARKNGVDMSFVQWVGGPTDTAAGLTTNMYGTVGSILSLLPGEDIGLQENEAPGMSGQFTFQITMQVNNRNLSRQIYPALVIVSIDEGFLEIDNGRCTQYLGGVSANDVMIATPVKNETGEFITYNTLGGSLIGGNIFSSIFNAAKKGLKFVNDKVIPVVQNVNKALGNGYPQQGRHAQIKAPSRRGRGGFEFEDSRANIEEVSDSEQSESDNEELSRQESSVHDKDYHHKSKDIRNYTVPRSSVSRQELFQRASGR